ncbi:MAG: hypothetical protein GEU86_10250 [Actinophytocola sp.]|nr:hypothetical protein [Actinophytocola sp.]
MTTPTKPKSMPRLLIDLPPGFAGLTITGDDEQDTPSVADLAARIARPAGRSTEQMAEYVGLLASLMADNQARLFGRFATSDQHLPEPVVANFVLAMPELAAGDSDVAGHIAPNGSVVAAQLEKIYRKRHPAADVRVVELAVGPAMVAATAGEYRLPPEVTGQSAPIVRPEFKAEFQIPAPDGSRLVVIAVTTDSEAGWPAVAAEAMRIANSVRFEEPDDVPADSPDATR